jgi:hypothetical protein
MALAAHGFSVRLISGAPMCYFRVFIILFVMNVLCRWWRLFSIPMELPVPHSPPGTNSIHACFTSTSRETVWRIAL